MTKKIVKNIIIGSALILIVFGLGLYTNIIKLPITNTLVLQSSEDFSDDRILMGASNNVFVGKVIKQIGDKRFGKFPATQFAVEVIDNIKGNLQGTVVVDRLGGYKYGMRYVVHNDTVAISKNTDLLLKIGTTYLFATRYNSEENWYTVMFYPNTGKIISRDANLNRIDLEILSQNDERVSVLREAYKNEILSENYD
ncbi:MAG: hypothetical protein Q7K54_01770 [Candidatus Parcubacteria bacterium]|nr:hypothetical protein [Candidatus Parcubacteria bacterium]